MPDTDRRCKSEDCDEPLVGRQRDYCAACRCRIKTKRYRQRRLLLETFADPIADVTLRVLDADALPDLAADVADAEYEYDHAMVTHRSGARIERIIAWCITDDETRHSTALPRHLRAVSF